MRSATVTQNGKRVGRLTRRHRSMRISLKGSPKRTTVVRIRMKLKGGRKVTDTRVYHPCTRGKKHVSKHGHKHAKR